MECFDLFLGYFGLTTFFLGTFTLGFSSCLAIFTLLYGFFFAFAFLFFDLGAISTSSMTASLTPTISLC